MLGACILACKIALLALVKKLILGFMPRDPLYISRMCLKLGLADLLDGDFMTLHVLCMTDF